MHAPGPVNWKQHSLANELEVDYPSQHGDGKLPILYLKVWVEKKNRVVEGEQGRPVSMVLREFFHKDFSSRSVVNNGNRTEWSPIRFVIIPVINKIGRPRSGSPIC